MDLSMELGNIEVVVGLIVILLVAPLLQFWTLKLGLNGMREDVKEIRGDVKTLVAADAVKTGDIRVHNQRLKSLEGRMEKVEE